MKLLVFGQMLYRRDDSNNPVVAASERTAMVDVAKDFIAINFTTGLLQPPFCTISSFEYFIITKAVIERDTLRKHATAQNV